MKRREIFLVVVLILFGLTYTFFKSEEFTFFDACSSDYRSLLDKNHAHDFVEKGMEFENIKKVILHNPAGNITFRKAEDNRVAVMVTKKIFHRSSKKALEIEKNIHVAMNVSGGILDIKVVPSENFPYQRARIFFQVWVADDVELELFNRYGNLEIIGCGRKIEINGKYGDILAKDIFSGLNIIHGYGNITLDNIREKTDIYTRYSTLKMFNSHSLQIDGKHIRLQIVGLENGIRLRNSHENIDVSDVKGDMNLDARHCKIRLLNIDAELVSIKNSYDDILIENLWSDRVDISVSHGDVKIKYFEIKEKLDIRNRYSNIGLEFSPSITPLFNIGLRYGKVVNTTPLSLVLSRSGKDRQIYTREPGIPEIVIENSYGDIILSNTTK